MEASNMEANQTFLNHTELQVLIACTNTESEETSNGCLLFQVEDINVPGLTKNQIKGYLSQLKLKNLFEPLEDSYYSGLLTKEAIDHLNK